MKVGHFKRSVYYSLRVAQQESPTFFIFILFHTIIEAHFTVSLKKMANISDK